MNSLEIDLAYGFIGILLYWFRNPDKAFLNWISVLLILLFLSQFVFFFHKLTGQICWTISSLSLIGIYSVRFKRKDRTRIDYLKPFGLLLLIVYQLPFYSFISNVGADFWTVLRYSTFFIVGTIFVYDRWILKSETMRKRLMIIIVTQSVVILLVLIYAFVQKSEADKQLQNAEEQRLKAEEQRLKAEELRLQAERNAEAAWKKRELENAR